MNKDMTKSYGNADVIPEVADITVTVEKLETVMDSQNEEVARAIIQDRMPQALKNYLPGALQRWIQTDIITYLFRGNY